MQNLRRKLFGKFLEVYTLDTKCDYPMITFTLESIRSRYNFRLDQIPVRLV